MDDSIMFSNVPSHAAHWCHLANMIELVLPWAHSSPQPKRQISRFSYFSTSWESVTLQWAGPIPP